MPVSTTVTSNRSARAVTRNSDGALGVITVAVLDRVGECLTGGDEHVEGLIGIDPGLSQPPAQCGTGRSEMARVRRKLDLEGGAESLDLATHYLPGQAAPGNLLRLLDSRSSASRAGSRRR